MSSKIEYSNSKLMSFPKIFSKWWENIDFVHFIIVLVTAKRILPDSRALHVCPSPSPSLQRERERGEFLFDKPKPKMNIRNLNIVLAIRNRTWCNARNICIN